MRFYINNLLLVIIFANFNLLHSEEMVIGKEWISPGANIIFECAIKDSIKPTELYLKESESDIHIEALVTWSANGPKGSIEGGFIPYLNITAKIISQNSRDEATYNLIPHLNMSDNFHYANNIKLPGKISDLYTVVFRISPPKKGDVGFHYDWRKEVNNNLITEESFIYKDQNFEKWANLSRR